MGSRQDDDCNSATLTKTQLKFPRALFDVRWFLGWVTITTSPTVKQRQKKWNSSPGNLTIIFIKGIVSRRVYWSVRLFLIFYQLSRFIKLRVLFYTLYIINYMEDNRVKNALPFSLRSQHWIPNHSINVRNNFFLLNCSGNKTVNYLAYSIHNVNT